MKTDKQYNLPESDKDFLRSLPGLDVSFTKPKEDVWNQLSELISSEEENAPVIVKTLQPIKYLRIVYAAAAILVLMLASTAFMRFYTKSIICESGQHLTALLPDGSSIELNAGSSIKYHPYWWNQERHVHFEGEGFFKVEKGKSFEVFSSKGKTVVLGTSFNIYSRKDEYKVTCYTGKVRVISTASGESADILPNQQAIIQNNGNVISHTQQNTNNTILWRQGMFIFTATPINQVFEEIERQFGVSIKTNTKLSYNYSGNFSREQSIEDVMHTVCLALNLEYKKVNDGYLVSK
nr:FecR family protein [uncultured Carboxylicivirga sp.]